MQSPALWKFEDIKEGYSTEPVTFFISERDMEDFARISGDVNPLHTNDEFAKGKGFSKRVVYGMLLASKFSYLVGMRMPGQNALYMTQDTKFKIPVYIGEQLTLRGTVQSKSEATLTIELKTEILNAEGTVAVEGVARVKVLS